MDWNRLVYQMPKLPNLLHIRLPAKYGLKHQIGGASANAFGVSHSTSSKIWIETSNRWCSSKRLWSFTFDFQQNMDWNQVKYLYMLLLHCLHIRLPAKYGLKLIVAALRALLFFLHIRLPAKYGLKPRSDKRTVNGYSTSHSTSSKIWIETLHR